MLDPGASKLVSIIVPTFNRGDCIGETLQSIIAQDFTDWETIVVDDGSTDHTIQVLERFTQVDSRIRFYRRDINPKGPLLAATLDFRWPVGI